jgi:hypothetical protein
MTEEKTEIQEEHATKPVKRRSPIAIGGRKAITEAVAKHADILVDTQGSILLTARNVLDIMKEKELMTSLSTANIRGANGVADALGYKGLDLPFVIQGTKRLYLIPAARWTAESKAAFYDKSDAEKVVIIEDLMRETANRLIE